MKKICLLPRATYGSASLVGFAIYMDTHRERLAQLFEKEVNPNLFERPARQVGSLLRLIGLKQELAKANKGGNRGGATYRIEPKTYGKMMDLVKLRAAKAEEARQERNAKLKGAT